MSNPPRNVRAELMQVHNLKYHQVDLLYQKVAAGFSKTVARNKADEATIAHHQAVFEDKVYRKTDQLIRAGNHHDILKKGAAAAAVAGVGTSTAPAIRTTTRTGTKMPTTNGPTPVTPTVGPNSSSNSSRAVSATTATPRNKNVVSFADITARTTKMVNPPPPVVGVQAARTSTMAASNNNQKQPTSSMMMPKSRQLVHDDDLADEDIEVEA